MKTKKIITKISLCSIILIPFYSNIFATSYTNSPTPLQFSIMSIKNYFDHNRSFGEGYNGPSRTDIFHNSLSKYIREIYNNNYYAEVLSQDGSHFIEFLEISNETNLDTESLYTCLRLLYNKIKSCEIIDDLVINQILEPLPNLVSKYFDEDYQNYNISDLKENIEKLIISKLKENSIEFKNAPTKIISNLSETISLMARKEIETVEANIEKHDMTIRLREIIIKFFELALSKTIWNHTIPETVWKSFISIEKGFQNLAKSGILDHMDDLDDLQWSLVHRFCFFLDLLGASLPTSFYEEVEKSLMTRSVTFLEAQEQDEGIKTKKAFVLEALIKAKAKAIAFEKRGILTSPIY